MPSGDHDGPMHTPPGAVLAIRASWPPLAAGDVPPPGAQAGECDSPAVGRPGRVLVVGQVAGDLPETSRREGHYPEVQVPRPVAGEGDLPSVWGPRRLRGIRVSADQRDQRTGAEVHEPDSARSCPHQKTRSPVGEGPTLAGRRSGNDGSRRSSAARCRRRGSGTGWRTCCGPSSCGTRPPLPSGDHRAGESISRSREKIVMSPVPLGRITCIANRPGARTPEAAGALTKTILPALGGADLITAPALSNRMPGPAIAPAPLTRATEGGERRGRRGTDGDVSHNASHARHQASPGRAAGWQRTASPRRRPARSSGSRGCGDSHPSRRA